jgi:hypothetical protein
MASYTMHREGGQITSQTLYCRYILAATFLIAIIYSYFSLVSHDELQRHTLHQTLEKNIVLVKVVKTAGSTAAGVIRHIAAHHDLSGVYSSDHWINEEPGIWAHHTHYDALMPKIANLTRPYYLVTWIRDPISRCLSHYYNEESKFFRNEGRMRDSMDDKSIINFMYDRCKDFQYIYISRDRNQAPNDTINMYDLVGITEDFDRSLVVMKHHLGLQMRDILYVYSSKNSEIDPDRFPSIPIEKQQDTVKLEFLRNFSEINRKDVLLYDLAKKRLNAMIRAIPNFDAEYKEYKSLKSAAQQFCNEKVPGLQSLRQTDSDATRHECYVHDQGCGYKCADRFMP